MRGVRTLIVVACLTTPFMASAQNLMAPRQIDQLACSSLTVQSVGNYRDRFGFSPRDWSSAAEDALSRKIDECFPGNLKSSSKLNDDLQSARQQAHLEEMHAAEADKAQAQKEAKQIDSLDPQATLIGEQLFVEKHCPMVEPDHDMFSSVIHRTGSPHLIDPEEMSNADRQAGQTFLQIMETKTDESRGFRAGSPKDVEYKCLMAAHDFVDVAHLYKMVR